MFWVILLVVVIIGPVHADPTPTSSCCTGDCGGDGQVTIDELILMVNIDLGTAQPGACPNSCALECGPPEIVCFPIIFAINNALHGCPTAPVPTPTQGEGAV